MTKIEKILIFSLSFFLLVGVGVKAFYSHQSKVDLKVVQNESFTSKKEPSPSPDFSKRKWVEKDGKKIFLVDINKGTLEEWIALPFVGEKTARRIVQYRTENGPFKNKEDLLKVEKISPAFYKKIEPYLLFQPDEKIINP